MAIARAKLVDLTVTRWYHCVSRCVRKACLLGEGEHSRQEWLENRLEELAEIFAVAVGGFAVMHNHLHVLVRLDPEVAQGWSDLEVVQRWGRLFPPRDKFRQPIPVTDQAGRRMRYLCLNTLEARIRIRLRRSRMVGRPSHDAKYSCR